MCKSISLCSVLSFVRGPAQPGTLDGEALEQAVALPYDEALRLVNAGQEAPADFYRAFHQSAIHAMLAWLAADAR